MQTNLKVLEHKCVEWIHLTQDRAQWCTLVNMIMIIWNP
jgi:hypothetical protein